MMRLLLPEPGKEAKRRGKLNVFVSCPLYSTIREKCDFCPENADDLTGLVSERTIIDPTNLTYMARATLKNFLPTAGKCTRFPVHLRVP